MMPMQQNMQRPQLPGAQNTDETPTWEEVMAVLRDGTARDYKIDIETDSTINVDADMQALMESYKGIFDSLTASAPLMERGMLPLDAVKEIVMTVVRRSKMGSVVEDAFDKLRMPAPTTDPSLQIAQMKAQSDMQEAQLQAQIDAQSKQHDIILEQQRMQLEAQFKYQDSINKIKESYAEQTFQAQQDKQAQILEHQREMQRIAMEANNFRVEQMAEKAAELVQIQFEKWKAELDSYTKLTIAQLNSKTVTDKVLLEDELNTAEKITKDVDS